MKAWKQSVIVTLRLENLTYGNGVDDILGEQDALELNQEEVRQLGNVFQDGLLGLLRDGVVAARAEGAGNALLENELAGDLDSGSHWVQG